MVVVLAGLPHFNEEQASPEAAERQITNANNATNNAKDYGHLPKGAATSAAHHQN